VSEARDAALGRIAAGQRTIVTTAQLVECRLGKDAVAHRVKSGRLHPQFRGVYSVGCGELPPLAREQAALLACGERAFLSYHTAAAIWGLRPAFPREIEVTVVGRYCASRKGIRVHRIGTIDRRDLCHHDGLWVSSPARAVLEIAATLSPEDVAGAIDEGLARRVLGRREIEDVLARNRPCRGASRLGAVLDSGGGTTITRSRAEKAFLKLIREARLPVPEVNAELGKWQPDFMWPRERLIVEVDGFGFHGGPAAFHRDHEKDLAMRDLGFEVLRFTRDHVISQPALVLARVAGALARLAARG
jgi:very-short-patch-repair endonuclease